MEKRRIGELLVEHGYLTPHQVEHGLDVQKDKPERLCNILIDLGYLTEESFLEFLSTMPGTASVELSACEIDRDIIDVVPAELARRLEVVPIGKIGNLLTVAMVCPLDEAGRQELQGLTGLRVRPVLCSRNAVYRALGRYYKEGQEAPLLPHEEIAGLEHTMKLRRIARLVEEIDTLPTLPEVVSRVAAVVNDPVSSAGDLADVIATDGSLSAKVLKLANSPAFGFSRKISDIKHAVAMLGFIETQALAVSVSVFDKVLDTAHLDFERYWKHSFRCATLSKLISLALGNRTKQAAFVAGLLHDVGMVLLAMKMPGKQEQAAELRASKALHDTEAEDQIFGTNHAEVGYLLGEHWLLPADVTAAIRYHHVPEVDPEPTGLAAIVFLANYFCKLDETHLKDTKFDEQTSKALKTLALSESVFRRILNQYAGFASHVTMI